MSDYNKVSFGTIAGLQHAADDVIASHIGLRMKTLKMSPDERAKIEANPDYVRITAMIEAAEKVLGLTPPTRDGLDLRTVKARINSDYSGPK
jgi:hypothetical protein